MWAILGTLGILAIEASYVPQLVRLHQRKQAADVSVFFPLLNIIGRLLVFGYAASMGQAILGWGFLIGCVLRSVFLAQVLFYKNRQWFVVRLEAVKNNMRRTRSVPALLSSRVQAVQAAHVAQAMLIHAKKDSPQ